MHAELDRLAAAFAEHPGWTSAAFETGREAARETQVELAGQLRKWRTATRRRNARQARHHPWNETRRALNRSQRRPFFECAGGSRTHPNGT